MKVARFGEGAGARDRQPTRMQYAPHLRFVHVGIDVDVARQSGCRGPVVANALVKLSSPVDHDYLPFDRGITPDSIIAVNCCTS